MDKTQLIVAVLQQRIGELTSNYEIQIAVLRAEITELIEERNAKKQAEEQYTEHLNNITN